MVRIKNDRPNLRGRSAFWRNGRYLWSADARGGVMHIRPDGHAELVAQTGHMGIDAKHPRPHSRRQHPAQRHAMNRDGDFVIGELRHRMRSN